MRTWTSPLRQDRTVSLQRCPSDPACLTSTTCPTRSRRGAWRRAWTFFTLARRMGTSLAMIDRTYGHLVAGADVLERELLDAFDETAGERLGHALGTEVEQSAR